MIEDRLLELIDPALRAHGAMPEPGEDLARPSLEVVRYYQRPVRWNMIPVFGRALSVVVVVRQPMAVNFSTAGYADLLGRIALAANARFSVLKGAVLGLTSIVLTSEPIGPQDDGILAGALDANLKRHRVVPFGLIRVNLGQEAVAFSLRSSPDGLFSEPLLLADLLSESFRRFVPPAEF